nr:uncharacterized protein LOC105844619 isoform X2 [Hydra vulgaris]
MENKKLKSYQVVEFPALRKNQLSSVAVVPRNWIHLKDDQFFCLWPHGYSKKQVEGFVKTKSFLNKNDCKEYIINILGQSKSYETACHLAQTLEEESDVALTDGTSSEWSIKSNPGRCLESNSVPPPFPGESDDKRDSTVNITGVELFSGNVDSRRGSEEKLAALELRLTKLEDRKKISEIESFMNNEEIVVPPGLLMQSKEDLEGLNLKLQMKSEMAVYVEYLRSVGGRVERAKYVRRVLGAMFLKNFSVLCNLNGSSSKMMATGMGKIKLRSYHFVIKCLVSTVRIQYPNSKNKDFYPIFSRWFQGAIDQGDGRINRRAKSILIKNQLLLMNEENI